MNAITRPFPSAVWYMTIRKLPQAFVVDATGNGSVGVQGAGGAFGVEGLSNAGTGVHGHTFAGGPERRVRANNSGGSGVYGENDATG
jgi:hypothetical protein